MNKDKEELKKKELKICGFCSRNCTGGTIRKCSVHYFE